MRKEFFDFDHLPDGKLKVMSSIIHDAHQEVQAHEGLVEDKAEFAAGLRKLLEAKDCFVRSVIPANPHEN